jgi:hypothetical protein
MVNFLKYYLKYIILAIVATVALVICGFYNLNRIVEVEEKKSSYTRTQFDLFISSPDKAQVAEIEGYGSVDKVFPFYAMSSAFSGSKQKEAIFLLMSDDMSNYDISVFTEKTCVEGEFNKDGIMLDEAAADLLGAKVGDSVTFAIGGRSITKTVSGLYLTSTYGTLTTGLALVDFSAEISALYTPKAYSAAFITTSDKSAAKTALADYVGEGNVAYTYEEYVKVKCSKKPNQTDEAYEAECKEKYAAYREEILASVKKGGNQVADKDDAYQLVKDKIATTEESIQSLTSTVSIAVLIVFALIGIIFVITNIGNDRILRDEGMSAVVMILGYLVINLLTAGVTAGATFGLLYMLGSQTFFMDVFLKTALYFALPVVFSVPVILIFVILYVWRLYANY